MRSAQIFYLEKPRTFGKDTRRGTNGRNMMLPSYRRDFSPDGFHIPPDQMGRGLTHVRGLSLFVAAVEMPKPLWNKTSGLIWESSRLCTNADRSESNPGQDRAHDMKGATGYSTRVASAGRVTKADSHRSGGTRICAAPFPPGDVVAPNFKEQRRC